MQSTNSYWLYQCWHIQNNAACGEQINIYNLLLLQTCIDELSTSCHTVYRSYWPLTGEHNWRVNTIQISVVIRQINLITLFLLFSFSQPSYYLGGFKGISPLGGIVPLLSVNLLALHHVLYALGIQLGFPNSSQLRWVMGLHWCPTKLNRRKQFRDKFLQCFFYISTSEDSRSHVGCWRWLQHYIQLWKAVKNMPNL